MFAPSQWETALQTPSQWQTVLLCNDASLWLGANQESALLLIFDTYHWPYHKHQLVEFVDDSQARTIIYSLWDFVGTVTSKLWLSFVSNLSYDFTPCTIKLLGVYWFHSIHPSVSLSCMAVPLGGLANIWHLLHMWVALIQPMIGQCVTYHF